SVNIDSMGAIRMPTALGVAKMVLDPNNLEVIGHIEGSDPALNIHLKKTAPPPAPTHEVQEVQIKSGDVSLYGHLHAPKYGDKKTAIIIVGGRGCYAGNTQYDLNAKLLRAYGISVLICHKRGTGRSTGDCGTATVEDLASDVIACQQFLQNHPNAYESIGVMGSSAGGWVITKALDRTDFDFMISIVGPSTSVRDQQKQSAQYGGKFYGLTDTAIQQVLAYTDLMFDAPATEASFLQFQAMLKQAEASGWLELLDDTDVPSTAAGIDSLWVRRHAFDPGKNLAAYSHPMLVIYGEIDWIVPYRENIQRLEELFAGERRQLLRTVIAYHAEHGTEVEGDYIKLDGGKSYWHFYRISPQVTVEIVNFLRKNKWIE
ncbi:MAG: alpha/beta hydrolase, partial [Bacteroidota bacterium]